MKTKFSGTLRTIFAALFAGKTVFLFALVSLASEVETGITKVPPAKDLPSLSSSSVAAPMNHEDYLRTCILLVTKQQT